MASPSLLSPRNQNRTGSAGITSRQLKAFVTQQSWQSQTVVAGSPKKQDPHLELSEVSDQLKFIRKCHDDQKQHNQRAEQTLNSLLQELHDIDHYNKETSNENQTLGDQIEDVQFQIDEAKSLYQEELQNRKAYQHVMIRMEKNALRAQTKTHALNKNFHKAAFSLDQQTRKQRRFAEERFTSNQLYHQMRRQGDDEELKRQEKQLEKEKTMMRQQAAETRREQRARRHLEIAEEAENADKLAQEVKLREMYSVHKFWFAYLRRRLEAEMQRSANVEDVFNKIRAGTGVGEIQEVVDIFLNREATHKDLLEQVHSAELKLDELSLHHASLRKTLRENNLLNAEESNTELNELQTEVSKTGKEFAQVKVKLERSIVVYDQVVDWGTKMLERLSPADFVNNLNVAKGKEIFSTVNTVDDIFQEIIRKINNRVDDLPSEKEELVAEVEKANGRGQKDLMKDVITGDFIAKNLRIQPGVESRTADVIELESQASMDQFKTNADFQSERRRLKTEAQEREDKAEAIRIKKAKKEKKHHR